MSRGPDRLGADRLVYFSDAVVAIAITLLVLPLVDIVPELEARHEAVSQVLRDNVGPFAAFLLSFVVIARLWAVHHRLFDGVERVDAAVTLAAQFWLLTIVVLPFPTALTGSAGDDPSTVRFYIGVLTASTLTLTLLTWLLRSGHGEGPGLPDAAAMRGVSVTTGLIVLSFLLVLALPNPSFTVLLVLFVEPLVHLVWRGVRRVRG